MVTFLIAFAAFCAGNYIGRKDGYDDALSDCCCTCCSDSCPCCDDELVEEEIDGN